MKKLLVVVATLACCTAAYADGPSSGADSDGSAAYIRDVDGRVISFPAPGERPPSLNGGARDDRAVTPEPGTLTLLGLGLAAMGLGRRRRAT